MNFRLRNTGSGNEIGGGRNSKVNRTWGRCCHPVMLCQIGTNILADFPSILESHSTTQEPRFRGVHCFWKHLASPGTELLAYI